MKILVLCTDYPCDERPTSLMYVHVRNKYYTSQGIDVTVLNFMAHKNYMRDGIPVVTLDTYNKELAENEYDILVCHAPNIRNHYRFLRRHEKNFAKIVFFFHGHEVLRINKTYPSPYKYNKQDSLTKRVKQEVYDTFKLRLWRTYFSEIAYKSHFVFVSQWILDEFLKWTKVSKQLLNNRYSIIHNSVGKPFEVNNYDCSKEKEYDFITIRSFLDGSKYCVDIVNELAKKNSKFKFLLIGKGEYFNHYNKANNITWLDRMLTHEEAIQYINQAKCALMPTRQDTQGVMMCEMATFGIPLITSDISVCRNIFSDFDNVALIENDDPMVDLTNILETLSSNLSDKRNTKYFEENTSGAEVALYYSMCEGQMGK